MKLRTLIAGALLILSILLPIGLASGVVYAAGPLDPACERAIPKPAICNDAQDPTATDNSVLGPDGIIAKIVNILSLIGGVIAVIVILIGAVKLVTSGGDANSISSSRRTLLYGLVSVAIIAAAQIIVRLLISRLPG